VVIEPVTVPGAAAPFIAITVPDQQAVVDLVYDP
jgi:hypothetical protein